MSAIPLGIKIIVAVALYLGLCLFIAAWFGHGEKMARRANLDPRRINHDYPEEI